VCNLVSSPTEVCVNSSMWCFSSQNGETALHAAALFGHMKITRLLMSYGADKNIKNKVPCTTYSVYIVIKYYSADKNIKNKVPCTTYRVNISIEYLTSLHCPINGRNV